jgi:UDP-N-acetylmuramyl tripeptide synthase
MTDLRPLWTSEEATELTGGSSSTDWNATGVSIDSRTIGPGDLFIPISGPYFDGHNFIENAIRKGAYGIIVSDKKLANKYNGLFVKDTKQALNLYLENFAICFKACFVSFTNKPLYLFANFLSDTIIPYAPFLIAFSIKS